MIPVHSQSMTLLMLSDSSPGLFLGGDQRPAAMSLSKGMINIDTRQIDRRCVPDTTIKLPIFGSERLARYIPGHSASSTDRTGSGRSGSDTKSRRVYHSCVSSLESDCLIPAGSLQKGNMWKFRWHRLLTNQSSRENRLITNCASCPARSRGSCQKIAVAHPYNVRLPSNMLASFCA